MSDNKFTDFKYSVYSLKYETELKKRDMYLGHVSIEEILKSEGGWQGRDFRSKICKQYSDHSFKWFQFLAKKILPSMFWPMHSRKWNYDAQN